nr:hypothetical protein [Tanacetum cinerariifolium]
MSMQVLSSSIVGIKNLSRHITNYGFNPSYKTWIHHGELDLPPPPPVIDNTTQPHMSDMKVCLNDLSYILLNNKQNESTQGDIGETSNESTQAKRNEFEELYASANEELYLKFFQNAFPTSKGYKLPPSYYAIKKTFKMIGLGYESIHAWLAADGFNPFGNLTQSYSMWPVIPTTYNLPLWLYMKESSFMLTLLIPGPKSPGKDIDVYLRPLMDDLKDLRAKPGFETIDVATCQKFNMRAMVLWTINDFQAQSSLCGWSGQGYKTCPAWTVKDKILVPKPPKNCARCTRCGYLVDGPHCQGCALLCQEFKEILVTHSPYFQNTSEPSNASTNVVNAPREPYIVKQDNGSFVDEIIFDLNRASDSPNQFHCFHCKDVLRDGEACKRCTCEKCGSGLSKELCYICGHNQKSLNDSPIISETSSQSPSNINHCCYECGDPLDGIFCKRCTCKSCGKDAHIGYNCPSKVPVISNPKPCNTQTIDELSQALPNFHLTFHSEAESPFTLDSTPTYVNESPNVFNPPPQPPVPFTLDSTPTYVDESSNVFNPPPQSLVNPCEFCENDAYYGHYCTPQAPFIYQEQCYNQDFNFLQNFQDVPQQYPCCDDCGVTHDAYQCQPMNEVYYYGQNSCYDSTSIGFDQSQPQQYTVDHPIFNAHYSYLDSQIQLNITLAKIKDQMTSITSLCELACQVAQKKLEEKQIEEERAAKAKYWKLPVCYNDDDDEERSDSLDDNIISGLPPFSAITPDEPILSTDEPDNSLSMGDKHLDTISATESDEFINSGVETLIPIPSESEGIPEHVCDVPSHDNSPPLPLPERRIS